MDSLPNVDKNRRLVDMWFLSVVQEALQESQSDGNGITQCCSKF